MNILWTKLCMNHVTAALSAEGRSEWLLGYLIICSNTNNAVGRLPTFLSTINVTCLKFFTYSQTYVVVHVCEMRPTKSNTGIIVGLCWKVSNSNAWMNVKWKDWLFDRRCIYPTQKDLTFASWVVFFHIMTWGFWITSVII